MTATPLTIGLPVYNGAQFLAETLQSILKQDHADFELVISDNASTDATPEICSEFAGADRRIRYVRHDVNQGAAWNYNYLVHNTDSELFKWAAHDDLLAPTALSRCVQALSERPDAVLSFTRRVKIDDHGEIVKHNRVRQLRFASAETSPHERFADWLRLRRGCIEVFGVMRRSALMGTGLHGWYPAGDRVLLAELLLRGPFVEVPEVLFLHREHAGRSVHLSVQDGQLQEWFDTTRSTPVRFPTWRLGYEYARGIARAPLPADERARCYVALSSWTVRRGPMLADNVVDAVRLTARQSTRRRSR